MSQFSLVPESLMGARLGLFSCGCAGADTVTGPAADPAPDTDPPEVLADDADSGVAETVETEATEAGDTAASDLPQAWSGVIGMEGRPTGDGRLMEADSLYWDDLPIPLRYVGQDSGAHDGAVVVGQIRTIARDGDRITAEGTFDLDSVDGREAARQVEEKLTNGISMDLDDVSFEIRIAAELLDDPDEGMVEESGAVPVEEGAAEAGSHVTVAKFNSDDELQVVTEGRIRAATIVAIPAFVEAEIFADASGIAEDNTDDNFEDKNEDNSEDKTEDEGLTASAFAQAPLDTWFIDPKFVAGSPLTVTDEGQVFGHLAVWDSCHISHAHNGCLAPPHSAHDYAYFKTGTTRTASGTDVQTGRITLDTRHAGPKLGAVAVAAHYDDTGSVVADVNVGEDTFGIWVAGAIRPGTSAAKVRSLRAAPLSGDWRTIGGNLELVAALAVNVPGFPLPRPAGQVKGGQTRSLVASGMVAPQKVLPPGNPDAFSLEDLRMLKKLAADARRVQAARTERAAKLSRTVRLVELNARMHPAGSR